MVLISVPVWADQLKVVVLYPQVKSQAYSRIFNEIIDGIKQQTSLDVDLYELDGGATSEKVLSWIKSHDIDAVIALGQRSYDIGHELNRHIPVIHGGVMIQPNGHSGVSLVVDPTLYFKQLSRLAPHVKRVFTVYSEESNGWLIEMARDTAKKYGIEFVAYEANSLRSAVLKLSQVLDEVDSTDAVWLLFDRYVPDKTALPMVLEAAWERRFVVFSNNPTHTKRGALFAMFPDHHGLGSSLAELIRFQVKKGATPKVLPSHNLKLSVNERTASHLGFSYSQALRTEFDLIYPVQ